MPGTRELLAVVLGVALGAGLVAAPRTALRLSVFAGGHRGRRGEYGVDGAIPDTWARIVRALGLACIAVAAFVAVRALG